MRRYGGLRCFLRWSQASYGTLVQSDISIPGNKDGVEEDCKANIDNIDTQLQRIHDLSRSIRMIMKKKPSFHGGRKYLPSGFFGRYELISNSGMASNALSSSTRNDSAHTDPDDASSLLQEWNELRDLYYDQYAELSNALSSVELLQSLKASVKWYNDRKKVNGLPMHRIRRHMRVCFGVRSNPDRLHLVNPNQSRSLVDNQKETSVPASDSFHLKFTRSLRDRKTLRSLIEIVESEWPQKDGSAVVPLVERLKTIV